MTIDNSNNILGIGTDIIEVERIRKSLSAYENHFLEKLFTKQEQHAFQKYQDPSPHVAGKFAAKEAIAKALGTGFGKELKFLDIEIKNDEKGKPIVFFSQRLQMLYPNTEVLISISHTKQYATATALWLKK